MTEIRPAPRTADGRFTNSSPRPPSASSGPDLKLIWTLLFNPPPQTRPNRPVPVHPLQRADLEAAPNNSLYRLGHSTVLMRLNGGWWLTDPVFCERAFPVQFMGPKRFHAPPIALRDLPRLRGVILSHDHYDHLDRAAIRALAQNSDLFLCPLGVGDHLINWGIPASQVRQFDWGQGITLGNLRLTATPAQHFSGRSLKDGNRTLWCSWVIDTGHHRLFFSGDSGYFDGFEAIGRQFGPFDLTLLETGAYDRRWPSVHMHPDQTVQAHQDLRGRWLLPIHNGTFSLALHSWQDPFEQIATLTERKGIALTTPMMGERLDLTAPHSGSPWWRDR